MSDETNRQDDGHLAELMRKIDSGLDPSPDVQDLAPEDRALLDRATRALRLLNRTHEETRGKPGDSTDAELKGITALECGWRDLFPDAERSETLGRFHIERELGRGGFGVVLLATDPKLEQQVALKIPRGELLLSDEARTRLNREARAATILSHPAIVPIYETGVIGIIPYIAYGFCEGPSLAEWSQAKEQNVSPITAAAIAQRLADALQHAHSRGIVHRDLKPSNVLLSEPTGHDPETSHEDDTDALINSLRVTDFGLARIEQADSDLTQSGTPLGTPAYMSPEQSRGEAHSTPSTDIFSLGTILYQLLTGDQPFRRETAIATLRAVETDSPAKPRSIRPSIPRDLEAICLKCLEKRQQDRYATAQELHDDLGRFLSGHAVTARPVGASVRLARWCRRNPLVAASLTLAFLSLSGGLLFSIRYGRAAKAAETLAGRNAAMAEMKSQEALTQARLAREAVDTLLRAIVAEPTFKEKGLEKFKSKLATSASEYYQFVVAQRPNDHDVLREYVDTLRSMANVLGHLGEHERSSAIWSEAQLILAEEFPNEIFDWAAVSGKLSEDYILLGKYDDAVNLTGEIVERLRGVVLDDDSRPVLTNLIVYLTNAAMAQNSKGAVSDADATINQAIDLVSTVTDQDTEDWPANKHWGRVLRTKCEIIWHLEAHDELDRLAPIGLRIYQDIMDEDSSRVDLAQDSMATLYQLQAMSRSMRNQHDLALAAFDHDADLRKQLVERHPDAGWLYFNLALHKKRFAHAVFNAGDIDRAAELGRELISWQEEQKERFPGLTQNFAMHQVECHCFMQGVAAKLGDHDEALRHVNSAIAYCELLSDQQQVSHHIQGQLGNLYLQKVQLVQETEDPDSAMELVNQAIAILEPLAELGSAKRVEDDLTTARRLREELAQR